LTSRLNPALYAENLGMPYFLARDRRRAPAIADNP
jgi:hypothetical protein